MFFPLLFSWHAEVRHQSSNWDSEPCLGKGPFPLEKTLPCLCASTEVLCSACDTHPSVSFSPLPAPSAAAAGPGVCGAASADPPGTCSLVIHMAAQISATTRKQEQFLLVGLLPFVLGFCFPCHCADGFCPVPVPVLALISPSDSSEQHWPPLSPKCFGLPH